MSPVDPGALSYTTVALPSTIKQVTTLNMPESLGLRGKRCHQKYDIQDIHDMNVEK